MRFGVYVPTFGEYDVRTLADLARDAEGAGWDGFFVWDHLLWAPGGDAPIADTTVALTAIALATERVRFDALVTPVARRRPWKLAKECATLDRLSGGRLVVGVGLGGRFDFLPVGEADVTRERAAVLDEGLEVLAALWLGEPVTHEGARFRLEGARMLPTPLQRPRVPIWVGGFWPNEAPFRRAARWDGALPLKRGSLFEPLSPPELRACAEHIRAVRGDGAPFDLVAFGVAGGPGRERWPEYEEAGATWWLESVKPLEESLAGFRARVVAAGPHG